jgi:hypothetical protein
MPRKRLPGLKTVAVCITEEQEKALAKAAEEDGSASVSAIVRRLIDDHLFLPANVTETDTISQAS